MVLNRIPSMKFQTMIYPYDVGIIVVAFLAICIWHIVLSKWWQAYQIRRTFEAQGIPCMPYHFPQGNLSEYLRIGEAACQQIMPEITHDIVPRILAHYVEWSKVYGERFVYWMGSQARYTVTNPEDVKQILVGKFNHFTKPHRRPDSQDLLRNGLATLDGETWSRHRSIFNPAFYAEKLKKMTPKMFACVTAMLENWDIRKEIEVYKQFTDLTAHVISSTAFGSNSYVGMRVSELQHEQLTILDKAVRSVYIPGTRFIPTAFNCYRWKVNEQLTTLLYELVKGRMELTYGNNAEENDVLGIMIAAYTSHVKRSEKLIKMKLDEVIAECKTFFFAGHETTSTLLTWTFLLLSTHPEWQERTRDEVKSVFAIKGTPTAESVNNLKIMGMVLNEALRLYPPASFLFRRAASDVQIGNVLIPAGTEVVAPVLAWHHDPKYWGPDADKFNPERFRKGVTQACKVVGAFMPFSMGPRNCIGQSFAILEAKVVLSTILQRYRFRLSPSYKHAPVSRLTLQPRFGMPILFEKLANTDSA